MKYILQLYNPFCVVFFCLFSGISSSCCRDIRGCRAETERDGTRAETRFGFPAKRTSPFKSAGVSFQSAAGRRGVRISGSNAG